MSTHYTVLARRFRPQTFEEVVGQDHIARALKNAIQSGRVAHAYLFTGARGVGKTSTARILAKALNCPNAKDGSPCNECEICRGISTGSDVDVLEIDGASNRGIDDIRSLRANVNVRSMRSPHKIYIIDEVHMLTKEAFNALLKTLEEPPERVKFVFCTTEPNKVPDTILSRCQRFDFGTIETGSIAERLQTIAQAEGVEVDRDAIDLVARRAAGSMRDSQSLFDQLLAFGGDHITADGVHQLLGTAGDDRLIEVFAAAINQQPGAALALLEQTLSSGVQLGEFVDQMLEYLRDLMVIAAGATDVALRSVAPAHRESLQSQASQWGLATIVAALQILADAKSRIQRVSAPRAIAELALVRISTLENLKLLGDLVRDVRQVESAAPARRLSAPAPHHTHAPPPKPNPAVTAAPAVGAEAQKKSPEVATAEVAANPAPTDTSPIVEWSEHCGPELLTQLVGAVEVRDRASLQAAKIAISGPNRLDLVFPKSYDLRRKYCEEPAVLQRLEQVVARLTGKPVKIGIRTSDDEVPAPVREKSPVEPTRTSGQVAPDAYVQQALSLFGGTVVKDMVLPRSSEEGHSS